MNVLSRPSKQGIDYFPLDVNFSDDEKIEIIEAEFGPTGFYVILKLFMRIYGMDGYYMMFTSREQKLFSKRINVDINSVNVIINSALEEGIFDKNLYQKYGILTSKGIQKRYFEIIQRRKNTEVIKEYLLVDLSSNENFKFVSVENGNDISYCNNNSVNVDINSINVDINEDNVDTMSAINTQSKVKESKLTKLNYIFNLIINNAHEKLKMSKYELQNLKSILKRLDLEVIDTENIPKDSLLKFKVIYFSIYALYVNSYNVYLPKLNRDDLINKFLKTEKYRNKIADISSELEREELRDSATNKLEEFVNYFIKCLQELLEHEYKKQT